MQVESVETPKLSSKRKEEILNYLSFIQIPMQHLGGILKIYDHFQNYGIYYGVPKFTPYELYVELRKEKQSDMINTLGQGLLVFIWEQIVKTQKRQVFANNARNVKQLGFKVPSLFILRNATDQEQVRLEQQMYYVWYQIFKDLIHSKEIPEMPDLDNFQALSIDDTVTRDTNISDVISDETEDIDTYIPFMELDLETKIKTFQEMMVVACSALPYDIIEMEKILQENIENLRKLKQQDGQLNKRDMNNLQKYEDQFYFNSRNSKMLGRKKGIYEYIIFKEIPNFTFMYGKEGKLLGYYEGFQELENIMESLDYKNRMERELSKNISSLEDSLFFKTQVTLEEEKLISEEEKQEFYDKIENYYEQKDFQKLLHPYISTFVINKKKTPLSLDLVKDFVKSTAEIWQIHCSSMYQSRWGTPEERKKLDDQIKESDSAEKLSIYLQDMTSLLTGCTKVWYKECPNYRNFVPEMPFEELEKQENLQTQALQSKINFWSGDKQTIKQIWQYQARQIELSGNLEQLFLISLYFFDLVDDMIEKKEVQLKKMRKIFQAGVLKAIKLEEQKRLQEEKENENEKQENTKKSYQLRKKQPKKEQNKTYDESDESENEESSESNENSEDSEESSESASESEENQSYQPKSRKTKKRLQKNKKKKLKSVVVGGICYLCNKNKKSEVILCFICEQYSHLSCNNQKDEVNKNEFMCKNCQIKKENVKTRGQRKQYKIDSESEHGSESENESQ